MSVNENDSRVRRTKKLIRQGLVELAKTKSINKITVKELTDLVEINRGTFYLHYKDVFELVDSIEEELYHEFDQKLESIHSKHILTNPVDVCEVICDYFYEHKDLFGMLTGENGDAKFVLRVGELLNKRVYELFKDIFPNMDKAKYDLAYTYGKFGLVGLIYCWTAEYPQKSSREIAETWFNLTILGLWGIIGDEAKEILLKAHQKNEERQ